MKTCRSHCSGILGAVGDNGLGISGVNQLARLMAVKVLDANGSGYDSDIVRGLNYALMMGAHVTSNSYGGPGGYTPPAGYVRSPQPPCTPCSYLSQGIKLSVD